MEKDEAKLQAAAKITAEQAKSAAIEKHKGWPVKYVELKNLCCHDLDELWYELRKAIARLRHKPHVMEGCIRQVGCYS